MKTKISLQTVGVFATLALAAANVAPKMLHISAPLRPWIFLLAIVWAMLVVSGVFLSW